MLSHRAILNLTHPTHLRCSPQPPPDVCPDVCIVGGGFTGIAAAIALLTNIKEPFRLLVVEPTNEIGRGVAFGGHYPLQLLNVRTRDLSVRAEQPGDFVNWAFRQLDQGENHMGLHESLAHTFLPRQLFGEYVRQRFFEAVEQRPDVELKIVNSIATNCVRQGDRYKIEFDRAEPLSADVVVLATAYGTQNQSSNGALGPYDIVSGERLAQAETIALIGSSLTMVDVLQSARRNGFKGIAFVISSHGQLPHPHASKGVTPQKTALPRSKRLSLLTIAVRLACEAAQTHGTPWQAIINGLRPSIPDIWLELPAEEQSRFLRHIRPYWDAHRHRLPIAVHANMQSEFSLGNAVLLRGHVTKVRREPHGFKLNVRRCGVKEAEIIETNIAFDCADHKPDLDLPLIRSLLEQGLARTDPHQLGLAVMRNGQVLGTKDAPTRGLFALGPLGQGSLWEIAAVPEIVQQADKAAQGIAKLTESVDQKGQTRISNGRASCSPPRVEPRSVL
jgi:uncharacterized NAD(P)/FAD-binding protein YdhS